MNRAVVIHHRTAWCRRHRASSRCPAGRGWRWGVGPGGTRGASAPLPLVTASWPPLPPAQHARGQHDRHGMPRKARPQPPLGLVPAPLALGLFMTRLERRPPMGIAHQPCERPIPGQVAPARWAFLGLAPRGSLPDPPALVAVPGTAHAPAAHRHDALAPPAFGAPPPAGRAPRPARPRLAPLLRAPPRAGRRLPCTHRERRSPRDHRWCLPGLQARACSRRSSALSGSVWQAPSAGPRPWCRRAGACAQA